MWIHIKKKAVPECILKIGDQVFQFPWSKNHIKVSEVRKPICDIVFCVMSFWFLYFCMLSYGSLYVTLCFVLCPFGFFTFVC